MKILNKEITKKQVKVFIGGVVATVVGGTIIGVVLHNKENDVVDVEYEELNEVEEPLELDSYREEEA